MNAPPRLAPPDRLLAEALDRLAQVVASAGHEPWNPPAVPVASDRIETAVARFALPRAARR